MPEDINLEDRDQRAESLINPALRAREPARFYTRVAGKPSRGSFKFAVPFAGRLTHIYMSVIV
jgi:hypothetical protein